jgi:hypothetical protein
MVLDRHIPAWAVNMLQFFAGFLQTVLVYPNEDIQVGVTQEAVKQLLRKSVGGCCAREVRISRAVDDLENNRRQVNKSSKG